MAGVTHKSVGPQLTQAEYEAADSHEVIYAIPLHTYGGEAGILTHAAPGTTYVHFLVASQPIAIDRIDWTALPAAPTHILFRALCVGNEAGAGKGLKVYNHDKAQDLAEILWDGSAAGYRQPTTGWVSLAGKNLSGSADLLEIYVKGSSATENITMYNFQVWLKRAV